MSIQPQYTDYKRFFTSIGLILISLSVLIPWVVLKEPLLVTLKEAEIKALPTISQYNVQFRLFMSFGLSIISFCISPILFLGGVVLLSISLPAWIYSEFSEQRLVNGIKRLEYQDLNDKHVQLAKEREFLLRNKLKAKIAASFPEGICEIQETSTTEFIARYDWVLHFSKIISPDIFVKVSYTKANPNLKLLEKRSRLLLADLWKRKSQNFASRAVIIILHENLPNKAIFNLSNRGDVIIQDLSENDVDIASPEKLLRLFFPANLYPTFPWQEK